MWELDYKESWVLRNWCSWTLMLDKTLESPLDCKEIQPVHPKGNQSWVFIGRTDGEAETPVLWPHNANNWLIWKDPDAGKDWRQEEKAMTDDEMVGWHDRLNGVGSWWWTGRPGMLWFMGSQETDMTERLNWTEQIPAKFSHWPFWGRLLVRHILQNTPGNTYHIYINVNVCSKIWKKMT